METLLYLRSRPDAPSIDSKNKAGNTAVHLAISSGHGDMVEHLVAKLDADVTYHNSEGLMPHHLSASLGQLSILQWLVLNKPFLLIAQTASKQTALQLAMSKGHLECVKWLLEDRGAKLPPATTDGNLPHHICGKRID